MKSNIFRNIIDFANDNLKERLCQIGEKNLRYNLNKWIKKGTFYILNNISENITLVQLMDTLGNVNHAINIVDYCIFDSNYDKELHLTRESLYLICYHSVIEEQVVKFEIVFYAVRYLCSPGNLKTE